MNKKYLKELLEHQDELIKKLEDATNRFDRLRIDLNNFNELISKLKAEKAELHGRLEMFRELFDPYSVENTKYIRYDGKTFVIGHDKDLSIRQGNPDTLTFEAYLLPENYDVNTRLSSVELVADFDD